MTATTLYTTGIVLIVLALAAAVHTVSAREASDTRERLRGRQLVYVIAYTDRSGKPVAPVKIGIAKNPRERLATFQTANPVTLVIYETWPAPNARRSERAAHRYLADFRLDGEWFRVSPETAVSAVHMVMGQPRPGWGPALRRAWLWWKAGRVAR